MGREATPFRVDTFLGVDESTSPLKKAKDATAADVIENFEITEDGALRTRRGSMLLDYASRLRMANNAAFLAEESLDGGGSLDAASTYHYVYRYYDSVADEYTLPSPTRSVTLSATGNAVWWQIVPTNNPDDTRFTQLLLYRTEGDADAVDDTYYLINTTTGVTDESFTITGKDIASDASITGNPSIVLGSAGLDVDAEVAAIIDFKRRIGGNDQLFVSGPYIKSYERHDKIYSALTPGRLGSWVVFHNTVWYVNGNDFLGINSKRDVFTMGGTGPAVAPNVVRIEGSLDGVYRWVYTYYDDGRDSENPWESAPSPISIQLDLNDEGCLVTPNLTDAPTRATHWKLYRTTADGTLAEMSLVTDPIELTTLEYRDNIPDEVLSSLEFAPFDENDSPDSLNLRFIVLHNGRLFGAGNPDSPSTVYWTPRDKPEQWSELNKFMHIEQDDGEPITAMAVSDGRLFAFKKDTPYVVLGDPPVGVDRFGFKQGTPHWRALAVSQNGVFYQGENSIYFTNGNTVVDIGDNLSEFIENEADPTEGTLRASHMVDYQRPNKKQIIVSFRTMAEGIQNVVAGVYHYTVGSATQGWTFFKNFLATTIGIVEDSFDKDRLYIGTEDGRIYVHDTINGQDRAYIENAGANGQPLYRAGGFGSSFTDDFPDLANWNVTVTQANSTVTISPASFLEISAEDDGVTAGLAELRTLNDVLGQSHETLRLTLTDLQFISMNSVGEPLSIRVQCALTDAGTDTWFQIDLYDSGNTAGSKGIWITSPSTDGTASGTLTPGAQVVDTDFVVGTAYEIIIDVVGGPYPELGDTGDCYNKLINIQVDGVRVYRGLIGTVDQVTDSGITLSLGKTTLQNPSTINEVEIGQLQLLRFGAARSEKPEVYYPGEVITSIYESPWFNLSLPELQKWLERVFVTMRANFNGTINFQLFSDFIPDPLVDTTQIPVNGGTLWDVGNWDEMIWDGKKRTTGLRAGVNRTGNNFKVKITVNTLSGFLELYGFVLEFGALDIFNAPRGDEGVPEK